VLVIDKICSVDFQRIAVSSSKVIKLLVESASIFAYYTKFNLRNVKQTDMLYYGILLSKGNQSGFIVHGEETTTFFTVAFFAKMIGESQQILSYIQMQDLASLIKSKPESIDGIISKVFPCN
jgi:hypothetical protein